MNRAIVVQGALQSEIDYLLKTFDLQAKVNVGKYLFYECTYGGQRIVLSKTQMGEISSAIATTLAIQKYDPIFILNQGTAGALTERMDKGDIVIGERVCYISQYSTEPDKETDAINPWKADEYRTIDGEAVSYKAKAEFLDWLRTLNSLNKPNVYFDIIASGDVWTKDVGKIIKYNSDYGVVCEAMECSGAYIAANSFGTPLISVRVISNNELKKQEYDEGYGLIAQKLVIDVIDEFIEAEASSHQNRYTSI